jgi:murein DD-endopeptidase MepM/ murein hydrolase activator NlpD
VASGGQATGRTTHSAALHATLSSALAAGHGESLSLRDAPLRVDRDLARPPLNSLANSPAPQDVSSSITRRPLTLDEQSAAMTRTLEQQAADLVKRQQEAATEAAAAAKAAAKAKAAAAAAAALAKAHAWVRPNYGGISSPFGHRWGRMHEGVDLAGGYGSPILAATSGTVLYAGPESGYGRVVKILDWDGTQTWYGHMSRFLVKAGDKVSPGQEIAIVGAAGDATGPHLHFEVRIGGQPVDPIPFLAARGVHI